MTDHVHNYGGNTKLQVQGMKEAKTAATTVLGTVKTLAGGREIIYCFVTAAITASGVVYGTKPNQANHSNVVVNITASIGAKSVTICAGATAIVRDDYKDGFLLINDAQGEGHAYMIEGHASASSGSGVAVTLKDGLETTLTTASEATLVYSKGNVIALSNISVGTTFTSCQAGVSLITAAASSYVWMGKKGPWPAVISGTPALGTTATIDSAGLTQTIATATSSLQTCGRFMTTAATTEYAMVDFDL
jgi:hypothetical protein